MKLGRERVARGSTETEPGRRTPPRSGRDHSGNRLYLRNGVIAEHDPNTGGWEPTGNPVEFLELRASVIIGEIIHNLRAGLDYLVYALAQNDSGGIQDRTQFPIEDTLQGFTARRNTFLEGVSDENVAIIRKYQPFSGCWWTGALRDLSNADKHRELVQVNSDLVAVSGGLAVVPWNMDANAPLIGPAGVPPREHVSHRLRVCSFSRWVGSHGHVNELQTRVGRLLSVSISSSHPCRRRPPNRVMGHLAKPICCVSSVTVAGVRLLLLERDVRRGGSVEQVQVARVVQSSIWSPSLALLGASSTTISWAYSDSELSSFSAA